MFPLRGRATHGETAGNAHRSDGLRILIAPHIHAGRAVGERQIGYVAMRRPVDRGPKRLNHVGGHQIRIAKSIRTSQLIEAGIGPIQQNRIHAERIRHELLRIYQAEKHGLFIAQLIVDLTHVLAVVLVTGRVVGDQAARVRRDAVLRSHHAGSAPQRCH